MTGEGASLLRRLCREHTDLPEGDVDRLARASEMIGHISDLDSADVFIDCLLRDGRAGVVVAEAHPAEPLSAYRRAVAGELVMPEKEPAVFRAFRAGIAVRDIFAVTQENRTVLQAALPLRGEAGVIGVLIRERDISDSAGREKRYRQLADRAGRREDAPGGAGDGGGMAVREIHHRVKNNLQLVASMLGLQARGSANPEVRAALRDTVDKILGIASIHDVLAMEEVAAKEVKKKIFLRSILQKLCYTLGACVQDGTAIRLEGDDVAVDGENAVSVAMAVNELIANALKHAFPDGRAGTIVVTLMPGNSYSAIAVSDDGAGASRRAEWGDGLGMNIVRALVAKAGGKLRMETGANGSRALFDFANDPL